MRILIHLPTDAGFLQVLGHRSSRSIVADPGAVPRRGKERSAVPPFRVVEFRLIQIRRFGSVGPITEQK